MKLLNALAHEDDDPRTDSARDGYMAMGGYVTFYSCGANEERLSLELFLKTCSVVSLSLT